MALSETKLCNLSLARIGAARINNLESDTSVEAIQCRTHYEQTRDALLRSHWWRFATARVALSEDATEPAFEWERQFVLPTDFMRMIYFYDMEYSYALEGNRLLTNESVAEIVYVKKVTDPAQFDALFAEVLILQLATKLVMPLSQDKVLSRELAVELAGLMSQVRTIDRQETNTTGRLNLNTWNDARYGDGRILSQMGSND